MADVQLREALDARNSAEKTAERLKSRIDELERREQQRQEQLHREVASFEAACNDGARILMLTAAADESTVGPPTSLRARQWLRRERERLVSVAAVIGAPDAEARVTDSFRRGEGIVAFHFFEPVRTEQEAKEALVAAVREMGGDESKLGPNWGRMDLPLVEWHAEREGTVTWVSNFRGQAYSRGVCAVDGRGLPTFLRLHGMGLRGMISRHLCRLTSLVELHIWQNRLTALHDDLGALVALTGFFMDRNEVAAVPASIGSLTALVRLNLADNHISALPDSIGRLTELTDLGLNDNRLTRLPESIQQLTKLTKLAVASNRLGEEERQRIRGVKARCMPHCTELRL